MQMSVEYENFDYDKTDEPQYIFCILDLSIKQRVLEYNIYKYLYESNYCRI